MGGVIKTIGSVLGGAAPILGSIPGIGTIPAAIAGGAGGLMSGKGLGGALKGAAGGALGGLGGTALNAIGGGGGAESGGGLGGVARQIGQAFSRPEGGVDLQKIIGTAGNVMNMIGQGKQRKSAQDYQNAEIAQRNSLMSKILAPQNYNLNQQSSATPAAGAGSPGAY
jgi:hypothetical protein